MSRSDVRGLLLALVCIVILAVIVSSCETVTTPESSTLNSLSTQIGYGKDVRTGLCFAVLSSDTYYGYKVVAFTNVPCKAVQSQIK